MGSREQVPTAQNGVALRWETSKLDGGPVSL